jgi:hypothetical protein
MAEQMQGTIRPSVEGNSSDNGYDATSDAPVAGYVKVDSGKVGPTLTGGDDWAAAAAGDSHYSQV